MLSKTSLLCTSICALAAVASSQNSAPQVLPASSGQDIVRGALQGDNRTVRVKIHQPDGTLAQSMDVLVQPDHSFVAGFPKALEAGQIAVAVLLADAGEGASSAPVLVQGGTSQASSAVKPEVNSANASCASTAIRLTIQPRDGQTILYAIGAPSSDNSKCSVSVFINGDEAMLVNSAGSDSQSIQTGSTPAFSVQLHDPLASGQCLVLMQYENGRPPATVSPADVQCQPAALAASGTYAVSPGVLVSSFLDLGRIRSYFAGGIVLANDNGDFANAESYLSFNVDKNWLWGGPASAQSYQRLMLNTYFETRLTAIAVATAGVTLARQAASVSAGVYAPVAVSTWMNHRDPYALTLGPIAKVGFDTPVSAASGTASQADFYTNFGFGGRMGVSKMSYSKDVAPELVSYLDVVTGRYSNFDAPSADGCLHRPWRVQVEGILKVPGYPLVLGFQANVRQNLGFGRAWQVNAKDDLRFFFGTRFDVAQAVARLTGQK